MEDVRALLERTAAIAADYLESLDTRPVFPRVTPAELRNALGGPLPEEPQPASEVVQDLATAAEPGVVAMGSGRYFGFVIGGGLPAALAADWLASTWDQNAGLYVGGPSASVVEDVAREWVLDLLGLPADASMGFVTGTQMAHVTGLAAARHHVLAASGWDVGQGGLSGAPRVRVLVGAKRHITIDRALRLLGLGAPEVVEADSQGAIVVDALRRALADGDGGPTIVCAQAGEVNTGAFDDLDAVADAARKRDAWVHVDGAFGIWAAATPRLRHLVRGIERADSWTTDAHKWLNVPYDSGIVACAHPDSHRAAMGVTASYLIQDDTRELRDQVDWVPEFSRRARGFAVYAALRSLGRSGVAELVDRCCGQAQRFAEGIADLAGVELLNDVVLNQVLFRFEDDERTDAVLDAVQRDGRAWMSGTVWDGRRAIRISVSNWQTGDAETDLALQAFGEAAAPARPGLDVPAGLGDRL